MAAWGQIAKEFLEAGGRVIGGLTRGAYAIGKKAIPLGMEAGSTLGKTGFAVGKYVATHPHKVLLGATLGAAGYGYMSADPLSTPYQRLERTTTYGFAGFAMGHAGARGAIMRTGRNIVAGGLKGAANYINGMGGAGLKSILAPIAAGAAVGGFVGGMNENQTILGGATRGAAAMALGGMGARNILKGNYFSMRTGMAVGGAYSLLTGPSPSSIKGIAAGAMLGGGGVLLAKGLIKHPMMTIGTLGSAAIIGQAGVEAVQAVRSRRAQYDLGADGNLVFGLQSLRHG